MWYSQTTVLIITDYCARRLSHFQFQINLLIMELSSLIIYFVEHMSDARNINFGITNDFTT